MNACEIVKNIIPDGINQSREPIWERLLLPDFDEENPQNIYSHFNNPEDWLDAELKKLTLQNTDFEKEYYATKSLMSEKEYSNANFSFHYKAYVSDYFEYKKKWECDHQKISEIENYRDSVLNLLDSKILSSIKFFLLKFPEKLKERIWSYDSNIYESYKKIWEKAQTKEGKQNVLNEFERWWFFDLHGDFNLGNILEIRQRAKELKSNYIEKWNQLINSREKEFQDWEIKRKRHLNNQEIRRKEIENLKINYFRSNPDAVVTFNKEILELSKYNFEFEKEVEIDFNPDTRILLVEYTLPNIEQLPRIKETRYLSSKKEYKNIEISQRELQKLFDETCYSITLRSIYEILINDTNNAIDAVNFNGWIKSVNKATGKKENTCIISIQVKRDEYLEIELQNVEPKSCFKFFKGVGSSKLHGITAIQPILQIQKDDKRFVNSQNIEFDNSTNLALMDWEDFEHLIRELFEKEFTSNGGEVKVTQASRDGGVDAIAFDPDPIRGGKIVIQAKRYTNTVGVSAVRDLYGTVLNEGANKGILVTTSDYGSDSYEFAKAKPITLLNGSNLLYLLEKHGTRAKIDIKEAKRILGERFQRTI
jgi:HJR/Mrr/RecB family endonuclease